MKHTKCSFKLSVAILFLILSFSAELPGVNAQNNPNTITFDNQSGQHAIVKLIGPTKQTVEVPSGQSRSLNAATGEYYILTRYGSKPKAYKYAKGDPFTVTQTATQYSAITITLHKIIGGNYPTHPISGEEFEKTLVTPQKATGVPLVAYANGIVRDAKTGLEWVAGPDRDTTWDDARSWVQSLNLDGGGWRMPTKDELKSLYREDAGRDRNMTPLLKTTGWWVWSGETKGSSVARSLYYHSGGALPYWGPRGASNATRAFAVRSQRGSEENPFELASGVDSSNKVDCSSFQTVAWEEVGGYKVEGKMKSAPPLTVDFEYTVGKDGSLHCLGWKNLSDKSSVIKATGSIVDLNGVEIVSFVDAPVSLRLDENATNLDEKVFFEYCLPGKWRARMFVRGNGYKTKIYRGK